MRFTEILVGTQNLDKFLEITQILAKFGIQAVSFSKFGYLPEVEETGHTYEENAILKATAFSKATEIPCMSEDSGLEVDALGGEPGVYSARFALVEGKERYLANNRKLLQKLEGIPLEKRSAKFVCVIVLASGQEVLLSCRGECKGRITFAPRGNDGFGYDPVFEIPEQKKTFAELGRESKNQISHRAQALAQFCEKFGVLL